MPVPESCLETGAFGCKAERAGAFYKWQDFLDRAREMVETVNDWDRPLAERRIRVAFRFSFVQSGPVLDILGVRDPKPATVTCHLEPGTTFARMIGVDPVLVAVGPCLD